VRGDINSPKITNTKNEKVQDGGAYGLRLTTEFQRISFRFECVGDGSCIFVEFQEKPIFANFSATIEFSPPPKQAMKLPRKLEAEGITWIHDYQPLVVPLDKPRLA
jgi:hypothetical protein